MAWRTNTGGEEKTITVVCLWSTWGSPLWLTQREDKFDKHDIKKSWTYLTMSEEVLTAVFQSKKQPLHFLEHRRKWMPAFQPHISPPSFPITKWQPHCSLSPGWLTMREGIAGVKEWRPWPLRTAHGVCTSLLPSSPQLTALSPVRWPNQERASAPLTEHQDPSSALCPLALGSRNIHKLIPLLRNICQDFPITHGVWRGWVPSLEREMSGKVLSLSYRMEELSQGGSNHLCYPKGFKS